jgi:acyl-CoA reductase-like NAD-dependent aldehyde dehydrogenase
MKYQDKLALVHRKLFINGQYVNSKDGKPFTVINPSTESPITEGIAATNQDVDRAV